MDENPYEVLEVAPSATAAEVRSAFHRAVCKLHPDRNGAPDAPQRFQLVCAAYEALRDEGRRAALDARLRARTPPAAPNADEASSQRSAVRERPPRRTSQTVAADPGGGRHEGADHRSGGAPWPSADPTFVAEAGDDDAAVFDEAVAYFERHFEAAGRPAPSADTPHPLRWTFGVFAGARPAHGWFAVGLVAAVVFVWVANPVTWLLLGTFAALGCVGWLLSRFT